MTRKIWLRTAAFVFAALFCISGCAGVEQTTTPAVTDATTLATTTAATTKAPDPEPVPDNGWVSAIFGGGPFTTGKRGLKDVKAAGWDTIMLWSVHVYDDGTLYLNDIKVAENGKFVGGATMEEGWKYLKEAPTTINRIELSVGAWGTKDFEAITALINRDGTGRDTILYKNFKALADACGADAINYDDESNYNVADAVKFGKMVEDMGLKVTLCPFNQMDYWVGVYNGLGADLCDRIYLQCYDGGAYNNVRDWFNAFGGVKIIPGYWCLHYNNSAGDTAAQVKEKLEANKRIITGGFMWLYDDMRTLSSPNKTKDYAEAIESVGN